MDGVSENNVIPGSLPGDQNVGIGSEQGQGSQDTPERDYKVEYENLSQSLTQERGEKEELKRRLEFVERVIGNPNQQQPKEEELNLNPEYIPDVSIVEKIVKKELAPFINETKNNRQINLENRARANHPDWDETIGVYKKIVERDPELHRIIMSASDPAERMYQFVKGTETYQTELKNKTARQLVDRISDNTAAPATLNNINGASPIGHVDWMKVSHAEWKKAFENTVGRAGS